MSSGRLPQPRIKSLDGVGLRQLTYLREAARLESFTAAAESLGVSQPGLSQALAELERRLGVALFEPAGRNRRLTDDGREVLAFAERVLTEAAALGDRLEARTQGSAGALRVGMIDAASLYVLPSVIRAYREQHPDVELHVRVDTSNPLLEQLRALELDVVFAIGPPDPDIAGLEIVREPLHVYAPPDAADPFAPPGDAEWALYQSGSRTRASIDAGLRRLGIEPRVTLESGNPEVLRQMVALGLGWSVLPPAVAEAAAHETHGERGALVAERSLFAMRRIAAAPNPRAEALIALAAGARARHRRTGSSL
jgi:DNA-binding transcriptional LysR family regulator